MIRVAMLAYIVTVFAGCERSSRTVEIQPSNQGVKPDNSTAGNTLTKTGRIAIDLGGFAPGAQSADVKLLINDDLETQVVNLSGGTGTALVSGLLPGNTIIKVRASAGGTSYSGSGSATITAGEMVRTKIQLTSGGSDLGSNNNGGLPNNGGTPNNGGGPNNNSGTPNNGGTPNTGGTSNNGGTPNNGGLPNNGGTPNTGGNSDLDISIDIGGNSGGTNNSQNIWDGKSFKGNSMFNIEPVK